MSVRELHELPNLGLLYAKAPVTGLLPGRAQLPDVELELADVAVDRDRLAAYGRVCGFGLRDELPATYPHVLAFPLAVQLMADPSFPFALPGLVHVANRIVQHRPVDADERLTLRVRTVDLRPHPKGKQFDVVAHAEVGAETVWEDVSTYLHRGGGTGGTVTSADTGGEPEPSGPAAVWRVPTDTGRRYAKVSGDVNPIHLHPLVARLFGFPRHIAHGMWTKARCLAALEGRLPGAFEVAVRFDKPLRLPAEVAFRASEQDDTWRFDLRDARKREVRHLTGTLHGR